MLKSEDIKFSVVIPVFNASKHLMECLDSLSSQSYGNFEVICIDDGSTDDSYTLLQQRAAEDSRFIVSSHVNSGVAITRNEALDKASGEYVLFLDSDDWLHPRALQWLAQKVKNSDEPDVVIFPFVSVQPKKEIRNKQIEPLLGVYQENPFTFSEARDFIAYVHGGAGGKLIKKSLLDQNGIRFCPNLTNAEDFVLNLEAYAKSSSICLMNKAIYFYRQSLSGDTLSTSHISKIADSLDFALQKLSNYYPGELLIDRFLSMMLYVVTRPDYLCDDQSVEIIRKYFAILQSYETGSSQKNYRRVEDFLKKNSKFRRFKHKILQKKKCEDGKKRWFLFGKVLSLRKGKKTDKYAIIDSLYEAHVEKLKEKLKHGQKIKVAFLLSELSKIKTKSLMIEMLQSEVFDPYVLIITLRGVPFVSQRPILVEIENFCDSIGMPYQRAYDVETGRAYESELFEFDVFFYQAPWSLHGSYTVDRIAKRALTCYVPYYVPNYGFGTMDCMDFHSKLFRYYVLDKYYQSLYEDKMPQRNAQLRAVGHTMLDQYLQHCPTNQGYVIYAPHWSIGLGYEKYSTFIWAGYFMLEFAKLHPELKWVFKPHPTLKRELVKKALMSEEDVAHYYDEWNQIGIVSEGGDYIDLFRASKCLITDCGSFLVEYFPTKKPVISLASNLAIQPCYALKRILSNYYRVYNLEELKDVLGTVVLHDKDLKRKEREIAIDGFWGENGETLSAAKRVYNDLKSILQE